MRRRFTVLVAILAVGLLAVVLALPAAARSGMMGLHASSPPATGTTLSLAEARAGFASYLQRQGYTDLKVGELMQFGNNFSAEAVKSDTEAGAMELLMSLDGQALGREPGPAMMWNTAYSPLNRAQGMGFHGMMGSDQGMMGGSHGHGMMGGHDMQGAQATPGSGVNGACAGAGSMGYHADTAARLDQPLTVDAAQARLQAWLDQNRSGVSATDPTAFPGYVTFHTERRGQITGMVSVQATTGAIWEHTWHGDFVAMDTGS